MTFAIDERGLLYGVNLRIGVGEVTQYYLDGRPNLPGPHIELRCAAGPGLSGGPAFDQHGRVVGLLSTSFDFQDDLGPSYVSLLFPALVLKITPTFLPDLYAGPVSLLDMPPTLCGIEGRETIRSTTDPESGTILIEVEVRSAS